MSVTVLILSRALNRSQLMANQIPAGAVVLGCPGCGPHRSFTYPIQNTATPGVPATAREQISTPYQDFCVLKFDTLTEAETWLQNNPGVVEGRDVHIFSTGS